VLAYTGDACDHNGSNGDNAFCVVNEQGNHQRVVGHDTAQGSSPGNVVWSPDGHNLAYVVGTDEIHTLSIDTGRVQAVHAGRPVRVLTTVPAPIEGLSASPRGRYIALAAGTRGVWLVNSDGTRLRRTAVAPKASSGGALAVTAVAWSPDRYTVAYIATNSGTSRSMDRRVGIWTIRYDGGAPRQVVRGDFGEMGAPVTSLSWSSQGRAIKGRRYKALHGYPARTEAPL